MELISKWCEDLLEKMKNGRGQQPSTHVSLPLPTVLLIREIHVGPMCLDMWVIICGCIFCVLMLMYYGMYTNVCKSMYMWACVCMDVYWSGSCVIKWTRICTWLSSCIIIVYMSVFVICSCMILCYTYVWPIFMSMIMYICDHMYMNIHID